jgi:hypothetical protein
MSFHMNHEIEARGSSLVRALALRGRKTIRIKLDTEYKYTI